MNNWDGFVQHYTEGAFSPYVTELRNVSSASAGMLEIAQPAGEFPDPPTLDLVIIQSLCRASASIDLGAGRFVANPARHSIVVCPPMSGMEVSVAESHRIRALAIPPAMLQRWVEGSGRAPGPVDFGSVHARGLDNGIVNQLMDRLWDEANDSVLVSRLFEDAALATLWRELLREAEQPLKLFRGGLAPWQVRRCVEYLNDRFSENVGLEQLASLVGLSPFHFARAFKHSTGMPPHRYQLKVRIERAKVLLEVTDAPVTEIAFEVGYESSQALARLFKRVVGLSPSDYRRQHRR